MEEWVAWFLGITWSVVLVLFCVGAGWSMAHTLHDYDCSKHGGLIVTKVLVNSTDGYAPSRICNDGYAI